MTASSDTSADPPSAASSTIDGVDKSPQARALGITTVSRAAGVATLTVPYRPELVGDPDTGVIAGGVVTTLLDHACGQAVFTALGEWTNIATLDLRIDYMRGAEPGLGIYARAHCYKLTRRIAFVRATAYDRDVNDPVAAAQAAFMLGTRGRAAAVKPSAGAPNEDGGA